MKEFLQQNWIFITYIVSITYCVWRFKKRYQKTSLDGVIGVTPGLDTIGLICIAPLLMLGDVIATAVQYIRKKK